MPCIMAFKVPCRMAQKVSPLEKYICCWCVRVCVHSNLNEFAVLMVRYNQPDVCLIIAKMFTTDYSARGKTSTVR